MGQTTTAPHRWLAEKLSMGKPSSVSQYLSTLNRARSATRILKTWASLRDARKAAVKSARLHRTSLVNLRGGDLVKALNTSAHYALVSRICGQDLAVEPRLIQWGQV